MGIRESNLLNKNILCQTVCYAVLYNTTQKVSTCAASHAQTTQHCLISCRLIKYYTSVNYQNRITNVFIMTIMAILRQF